MFGDHSPELRLATRVLVLEDGDDDVEEIIQTARDEDAVSFDGDETFWIVFANEPRRVWDFTEKSLRQHFKKKVSVAT